MKISVCMATYNGEKFIQHQINSILSQLHEEDEIIIADDGSIDNTIPIIESFNDRRIKLLHHIKKSEKYKSNYTTRNIEFALQNATGDLIFLADQDDVWFPNKIEVMQPFLVKYDLVISDCIVTDEDLNVLHQSYFNLIHSKQGFIHNIIKNSYLGCCMAFKRELLKIALPIPTGPIAHDIWIGLISDCKKTVKFIEPPTIFYRRHPNTVSTSGKKSTSSLLFKLYYRTSITLNLFKRIYLRK